MMEPDTVLFDIRTCGYTIFQVKDKIIEYRTEHPDQEVFVDGDSHCVFARRRV